MAHRRVDFRPNAVGVGRLRRAARVVAVSHAVRSVLVAAGVDSDRVDVVYDGVDPPGPSGRHTTLRDVLGVGRHTPVVLAVGALVEHKGHATLVDALALLPGVHAAVAGEGPLRTALLRRAARAGVADRLHLLGTRDDVPDLQRTADVVCHPSWDEGLGQAVLEALRFRCSENGSILIFDEVQCGVGRTGHPFAANMYGVTPDILTTAKALGAGFPVSAMMVSDMVAPYLTIDSLGTTFGAGDASIVWTTSLRCTPCTSDAIAYACAAAPSYHSSDRKASRRWRARPGKRPV